MENRFIESKQKAPTARSGEDFGNDGIYYFLMLFDIIFYVTNIYSDVLFVKYLNIINGNEELDGIKNKDRDTAIDRR